MPPLAIAAVAGGVASIGGAIIGSKAQKKAANTAAQTAQQNTAANNALALDIYNRNSANMAPYQAQGVGATGNINALLGITPPQPVGLPSQGAQPNQQYGQPQPVYGVPQASYGAPQPTPPNVQPGGPNFQAPPAPGAPLQSNVTPNRPDVPQALQSQQQTQAPSPAAQLQSGVSYNALSSAVPGYAGPMTSGVGTQSNVTRSAPLQTNVNRAAPIDYTAVRSRGEAMNPGSLTDFTKATGYNFRVNEGNRALTTNAAALGSVQSGAAAKALARFGQNIASEERQNWVGERDRYIGYNDAFDVNERGYRDSLAMDNRNFAFGEGQYLDSFNRDNRNFSEDQSRYLDQFGFQRGAYLDEFGRGERGYADQRGAYADQFNQQERATRNALAQYGDQFAGQERAFQTGREDYGRAYMTDQQRYADQFNQGQRQYVDSRGDYGRAYDLDLGRYQDVFAQGERGYGDSRMDYNRSYTDSRQDNYMNQLLTQQGIGLSGASALAGVGNSYLSNVTANNNSAASTAANAALARGAATQGMWAGIAGGVGNALGTWQMGGYGGGGAKPPYQPVNAPYWQGSYGSLLG